MRYTFKPKSSLIDMTCGVKPTNTIKNEPMIFGGSLQFAKSNGGELTNSAISLLIGNHNTQKVFTDAYAHGLNVVIDSRVTMTMKGAYPSIPGWHCDDVPRSEKYEQPDLSKCSEFVQHFMILFADVESQSCTEFVNDDFTADLDPERVWSSLHEAVESQKPKTRFLKAGHLIQFDQHCIHRASPTINPGWRFFIRLSLTHRKPVNEIRNQVQVYLPTNGGW